MSETDYTTLQRRYGGHYVAQHDGKVIASAETYDELSHRLDEAGMDWSELLIEYVELVDAICVY